MSPCTIASTTQVSLTACFLEYLVGVVLERTYAVATESLQELGAREIGDLRRTTTSGATT